MVQRQAEALDDLLALAISEAASAEQLTKLERVSADVALRFEAAEHERTERELGHLEHLKRQAVGRIRQLEGDGQTHAAQKAQLEDTAGHAQRRIEVLETAEARDVTRIAGLEAAEVKDLAQIADLEAQSQESAERLAALEAAAVKIRQRLQALGVGRVGQDSPEQETQDEG